MNNTQELEVMGFINRFHNQCTSRVADQFAYNLSWHFATILKNTFARGEVLYNYKSDKFVWRDTNNVEYTIDNSQFKSDYSVNPNTYLTEEQLHGVIFPRLYPYQEAWFETMMESHTRQLQKLFGDEYTKYLPLVEFNNRMFLVLTEEDDDEYEIFTAGYCYHYAHLLKTVMGFGEVAFCYGVGHCVWYDPGKGGFDILGPNFDTPFYIPEQYCTKDLIADYAHVPQWCDVLEESNLEHSMLKTLVSYLKEHRDEIKNLKYLDNELPESDRCYLCINLGIDNI